MDELSLNRFLNTLPTHLELYIYNIQTIFIDLLVMMVILEIMNV
mgnify:CR=1 FL=1